MDKKSPSNRRTKRQGKAVEENHWDCSVCTYRNTAEAFKCLMCDVRKGTSTRKPRINPQLVAQQVAQQFNPTPPKTHKREKSDKKSSLSERLSPKKKQHLRKLRNVDRSSAETREVTVNNVTVTITEYKPITDRKLLSDQSGQSSRASSESESSSEAPSADSDSRSEMHKLKLS